MTPGPKETEAERLEREKLIAEFYARKPAAKAVRKPLPHQRPIYGSRGSWRRKRSEPVL